MSLEAYGFSIYISTFCLSAIWIAWAFIPDEMLNYVGIIYYPSKYWATTIPSLLTIAYVSWFIYYTLSVLIITIPREKSATCKDCFYKPQFENSKTSIPPLCDISIEAINRKLNY